MNKTVSFLDNMLGFYYQIDNLPWVGEIPEDRFRRAFAVHQSAFDILARDLEKHPIWSTYYEICELSLNEEDVGGEMGFSFWIYSTSRFSDQKTVETFKALITSAYETAAAEAGLDLKFLRVTLSTDERMTTTKTLISSPEIGRAHV